MTKNIGPWALIAIAFNVCNSWAGLTGTLNTSLFQGGPVALVYGLLLSSSLYGCIALTIAELACVYPTAGGQYHFVSILAPRKFCRSLSYACGMITNFSWIATGAAVNMIFSEELMTLIMFYHPDFTPHPWHQFLFYQSFGLIILLYNLLALKKLPITHFVGCKPLSTLNIHFALVGRILILTTEQSFFAFLSFLARSSLFLYDRRQKHLHNSYGLHSSTKQAGPMEFALLPAYLLHVLFILALMLLCILQKKCLIHELPSRRLV